MKKALLLGAIALAGVTVAANAQAKEYGFYTASGSGYCDGVSFTGTAPATGFHIYDQTYCSYTNAALGGYSGTVKSLGAGQWFTFPVSQSSGDGLPESYVLTFYINTKALTWVLAYESTDYSIPFEVINEGGLQKGKPFAAGGKKIHQSVIHAGLASLKK
jgi:hypothetical protein